MLTQEPYKRIPLTKGLFALVDADDFNELSKHHWYASKTHTGGYMAGRTVHKSKQHTILMHRQIMNTPQRMQVDHINHDTLDNRKLNLRICTNSQNQHNRLRNKDGTSKYKGACWHKRDRVWRAQIMINGKNFHLGYFDNEEEAAKVYDREAIKHFGEFALCNF